MKKQSTPSGSAPFNRPVSYEYFGEPIRPPVRWSKIPKIAKACPYDGEKVWGGNWFAAALYPGPRVLVDLRGREYPAMIDEDRYEWPTGGSLRIALQEASYEHFLEKRLVLDGILSTRGADGKYDFSTITKGIHMPPTAVILADDIYSWDVIAAGEGSKPFLKRRKLVNEFADVVKDARVVVTKYKRIETRKDLETVKQNCLPLGFGVILREDAPYRSGRSGHILKIGTDE